MTLLFYSLSSEKYFTNEHLVIFIHQSW